MAKSNIFTTSKPMYFLFYAATWFCSDYKDMKI